VTEVKINDARECYRPVAQRAALLYFILNDLNVINPIYQFSLKVGGALSIYPWNINLRDLNSDSGFCRGLAVT